LGRGFFLVLIFSLLASINTPSIAVTYTPATQLTFTSLTPSTITTSTAPYDATLSAVGSNFTNVNQVTFTWSGAANGSKTWNRGDSDWNTKVTINSDTSMTLRPRVVEPNPTWSGTATWTVTLRDTTGATASQSFRVTYTPSESTIDARIESYSPNRLVEVQVGNSVTLSVTFRNTGNTAWTFWAKAVITSNGSTVAEYGPTSASLQPNQSTTLSWTHTVTKAGDFWLQFAVWKDSQTPLDIKPSPSERLIRGITVPGCSLTCTATVPATGQVNTPVFFSAEARASNCTGTPTYSWNFGDGGTSIQQNPSHTYSAPGTYNWSMNASLSGAACTKDGSIIISSGENSSIWGIVFSKPTGLPISGAEVKVGSYTAISDANGEYRISNIAAGNYDARVAKSGYATIVENVSIPPGSSVQKNFFLQPSSTSGVRVLNVASKYPGRVYYLDEVDHYVTYTVNVDWGGHPPGKVRFITPKGSYDVATTSTTASKTFNMGTDFGPCGKLRVQAISSDGAVSPEQEADFVVMPFTRTGLPPEYSRYLRAIERGDGFFYNSSSKFTFKIFDELIDAGAIPENFPLFGKNPISLRLLPDLDIEVTSHGRATYDLTVGNKIVQGKMAGIDYELGANVYFEGNPAGGTCVWDWRGSAGIYGSFTKSLTFPFFAGPVPMYFSVDLGLDSANGNLLVEDLAPFRARGEIRLNPLVKGSVGIGADEIVDVEGWVKGEADYNLLFVPFSDADQRLSLSLSVGVGACALIWCPERQLWRWTFANFGGDSSTDQGLSALAQRKTLIFKLQSRDYLKSPTYAKFDGGKAVQDAALKNQMIVSTTAVAPIQSTVFPRSQPHLSSAGDHLYLAWLYDNPQRNSVNRTMVIFSSWDGSQWKQPQPIHDDGTADFHPQLLTFANGSAWAAWEDVKTKLPESTTLDEMVANLVHL